MIAHIDRYFETQKKARIAQLLEMGFPVQVSTAALRQFRGRGRALALLREYHAVLVSDCHNNTTRPPDFDGAVRVLEKKLGDEAGTVLSCADEFRLW